MQLRIVQDCGRPLDRLNLGHYRRIDQPRRMKNLLIVPGWTVFSEVIADGVVFAREQRVCNKLRPTHQLRLNPVRSKRLVLLTYLTGSRVAPLWSTVLKCGVPG